MKFIYYIKIIPIWTLLTIHNIWGIINVFIITWLKPMKGGLVDENHPFATGINPDTGDYIWKENIVFSSKRKRAFPHSDEEIVNQTGVYMSKMVKMSMQTPANEYGKKNRMPPSINYIHGGIHYNGGWLIFDDPKDAIRHFSDPRFALEFLRFIYKEKREPVTLLRDRQYDRQELLEFVCFLRTLLPYFSNSNGNQKRIGWGNPAPFASINTITGFWKNDTYKIYNKKTNIRAARSAITNKFFLHDNYYGGRDTALWPEKYLAKFTDQRVDARGEKGNLYFVDLRKINRGYKFDGGALPSIKDLISKKIYGEFENTNFYWSEKILSK